MASPNSRQQQQHWPSMFRSKHGSQVWQSQPDMTGSPPSLVSGSAAAAGHSFKPPFSSGPDQERNTDTKPRWNPRPEQIRVLETLFNSGLINPTRDEIPRIRMRLQEYGPVGDSNVFYWFQNRKSRSKNKLRNAAARAAPVRACAPARQHAAAPYTPPPKQFHPPKPPLFSPVAPTSSSSSSSDRSSGSSKPLKPAATQAMSATAAMDLLSPLAAACHQQMDYQFSLGQPAPSAPVPAPNLDEFVATDVEPIFLQYPQGHCLSAGELAAILGAQYIPVPAEQQPPVASPAGMLFGLCNDVAPIGPTTTGQRSSASAAGLGQYWPSGVDQLGLRKNSDPFLNTSVAKEEAYEDFTKTKLGLLQYGLGVTAAPAVNAASAAGVLPLPASPDSAAVTVASASSTAGRLTSLFATTTTTEAVSYNSNLQGPAGDVGFAGAAAGPGATGTGVLGRGAAVVCFAGTSAACSVPATHLDVKLYFGDGAVLFRCNGERAEPLLVDDAGLTVEPLQHGGVYYCVLI
ncbi:WUSCHEL-related homeobox 7 [Hordeum vulgare]|nr:WUSCHEL-related homeobox 7 [Hordeum vulgare]